MYIFTLLCRGVSRYPPAPPPSRPPITGTVPAGQCSPLKTSADLCLYSLSSSPSPPPHTPTMCCMHVVRGGGIPPPPHPCTPNVRVNVPWFIGAQGWRSGLVFQLTIISFYCLYIHDFTRRLDWTKFLKWGRQTGRETDRDRHRD
jgi:hypothetical protein